MLVYNFSDSQRGWKLHCFEEDVWIDNFLLASRFRKLLRVSNCEVPFLTCLRDYEREKGVECYF